MKKPKPTDEQIEQEREESQGNNRMKHQKCVSIEALHEAGHAVMYVYLRHPFKSVDIVDKPHDDDVPKRMRKVGRRGGAIYASLREISVPAYRRIKGAYYPVNTEAVRRRYYEGEILLCVAGGVAERLHKVPERQIQFHTTVDRLQARQRAAELGVPARNTRQFLQPFEAKAMVILRDPDVYLCVAYVAMRLDECKQLSRRQVLACCRGMKRRRTSPLPLVDS